MKYPVNIKLTKLETLDDAIYPQEDRFPSNVTVKEGLMWEFSLPKVGESFRVLRGKLDGGFYTSNIQSINKIDDKTMILTTQNSKYKLEIKNE